MFVRGVNCLRAGLHILCMAVYVGECVCVRQCEFGHWVCGESWHVTKIFNPPPQFSRLGTLCPTLVACLFVS